MSFVPVYILILFFTIVIDYFAGIYIGQSQGRRRKWLLAASLVANIGVLAIFKYYNFVNENITIVMSNWGIKNPVPYLAILLPIGLSFHTFQAMSYTVEVYRGNYKPERNFGIYALYVMFYPQLVAGPIERPQNILHQFYEKHDFDYQRIADGLKLMAWGLFKKIAIADRLADIVNVAYDEPHKYHGLNFVIATIFFAFQIFCDFSGYTDIALGAAKVMGFKLVKNFNRPYHSKSISEFWSRWHISLSTWFRDYLYITLGGNRVSASRWYFNLFVVFLISGLWHGANWTYIIWGVLNGFYLIFAIISQKLRDRVARASGITRFPKLYSWIQFPTTFVLICISWVFFRAHTIADAIHILKSMFTDTCADVMSIIHTHHLQSLAPPVNKMIPAILVIAILETVHLLQKRRSILEYVNSKPKYIRWGIYYAFILLLLTFGTASHKQFIYFQF
ncbi:MBOAT family O-acyltransferase [Mucilaginibacter panaciglaebae]|uniref:MBOAT family protein n=1 Tax=Mucilaginibacter panaciglaebae TaxID=502331 RepID=A0ABP7WNK1_9SPHI